MPGMVIAVGKSEWLSRKEAAAHLRVEPQTLAAWGMTKGKDRKGPPFWRPHGGKVRYHRALLDLWAMGDPRVPLGLQENGRGLRALDTSNGSPADLSDIQLLNLRLEPLDSRDDCVGRWDCGGERPIAPERSFWDSASEEAEAIVELIRAAERTPATPAG